MSNINSELAETEIDVHWREETLIPASPEFIGQANSVDPAIYDRMALENFPDCYQEYADLLHWDRRWSQVFDGSDAPFWKWFVGGEINAAYNCLDRHLSEHGSKTAFHFVPEIETEPIVSITYQELWARVNEFAAVLKEDCGLKRGDRATLHMPMAPESVISMLACARLGIIHNLVFSGFSGKACGYRIADSKSAVLITMDAYYRGGKLIDHKEKVEAAAAEAASLGTTVDKVLVWQRRPGTSSTASEMVAGRDHIVNELLLQHKGKTVPPEKLASTDGLFIMYSSGTTGNPKGCLHAVGG